MRLHNRYLDEKKRQKRKNGRLYESDKHLKSISGTGRKSGMNAVATIISTSPAKILPNKRNENDIRRAISEKSSIMPTIKPSTDLKLTNFPAYFKKPNTTTPLISIIKKR